MEDPDSLTEAPDTQASRRSTKSEGAFRTISEVSVDLDVPQHVLRFWESKFSQIKPLKRGGGRRYYRPEDVRLLGHIRDLLYKEGYTIRGVQKLLREPVAKPRSGPPAVKRPPALSLPPVVMPGPGNSEDPRAALQAVLAELLELQRLLAGARHK
jgi:DNA-binding transcriptional MerR regulator